MDDFPIYDLEPSKHSLVAWRLPTMAFTLRDCLWPIVVVALAVGWGVDHWLSRKQSQAESAALTEARADARALSDKALKEEMRLNELLRDAIEVREVLVEQHEADLQQITKLRGHISSLEADLQASGSVSYTVPTGRER